MLNKKFVWIFPMLFVLELIFGVSGTMIVINGIAIRHILFILTFLSLYGYTAYYIWVNKIRVFSLEKGAIFGDFNKTDWFAVVFEAALLISMTIIPMIKGTNLRYAYSEVFDSAAIFSLYFALSFLIKEKEIDIDKFLNYVKWCIFAFGIQHIIFYYAQEADAHFMEKFFTGVVDLAGGNGIVQSFVLGHGGYTRITFNTSIYFLVGLFVFLYQLEANKWYDYIIYLTELVAMLTTMTKSIWLGAGLAFILMSVAIIIYGFRKNKKLIRKMITAAALSLLIVCVTDTYMFDHAVSIRLLNTFVTQSDGEYDNEMMQLDREGAALSNTIKLEQISKLLDKWKESPILGHGYGSYVEGYLRSEVAPFSYEMQLFALLMKIGILGLGIWIVFYIIQFVSLIRLKNPRWIHIFAWVFLLMSMVICVQTNPLLISFTGMSVLLFISVMTINELTLSEA